MILITFGGAERLSQYQTKLALPYDIAVDPDRSYYRAYGLGRGSFMRVWGWRAARRYFDIIRGSGVGGLHWPSDDTLQLGGDFVIGPGGTLAYGFWGEGPDDRPSVDELIAAVRDSRTAASD